MLRSLRGLRVSARVQHVVYLEGQRIGQAGFDEVPIAPGLACLLFRSRKCVSTEDDDADVFCTGIGAKAAREVKP